MGKKTDFEEEKFRAEFAKRLKSSHGNIEKAAEAVKRKGPSVSRWMQPGAALPGIYEVAKIADALGYPRSWLAYGDLGATLNAKEREVVELLRKCAPNAPDAVVSLLKGIQLPPAVLATLKHLNLETLQVGLPENTPKPAAAAAEALGLGAREEIRPVVDKRQRRNTRSDYPVLHTIPNAAHAGRPRAVPMFMQLAAGPGRELERCTEFYSFREFIPKHGIHAARVQGYSMLDTIRHGETILLQAFDEGQGVTLSALGAGDTKTPFWQVRQHIKDQEIWVLSINREEPTLKRVNIFEPHGDWFMTITADNPETAGFPRPIRAKDEVTFYAKFYAFVHHSEKD